MVSLRVLSALSLFYIFPIAVIAQTDFFTPNVVPYTTYQFDVQFNLDEKWIGGEGTISFRVTGNKPLRVIGLDFISSDYNLIRVKHQEKDLFHYNPEGRNQVNSPLYYILDDPIKPSQDLVLNVVFKSSLSIPDNLESYETQQFLPKLWWDGIPTSDRYRIKINDLPGYILAVGGRLDAETGYYENDHAHQFGLFMSREVEVIEIVVENVLVRVLYPENGDKVAQLALETAREVIPFYTEMMGMYPYTFLNILPGGPGVWGGYPFSSGMVVIHGMQFYEKAEERHWRWITAHEIGHEYWGEYVLDGNDPPWLWIALGIYADREFSQFAGISDLRHRGWANYYLDGVKKGYNTTFDLRPDEEAELKFDRNNYVIHAKGFSFISALEMLMGRIQFREAYNISLQEFGGKRMGYRDFKKVCESVSGQNLDWFFNDWVRTNNYLSAVVGETKSVKHGEKYESLVTVIHDGDIVMPVPVTATFEDGTTMVKTTHRMGRKQTIHFKSSSRLTGAVIDPSGYLANLTDYLAPEIDQLQKEIDALPYASAGDKAYQVYQKISSADREKIGDRWYKLGMALFDGGYLSQSRVAFNYSAGYGSESSKFISYAWVGHLYDLLGNRSSAIESYKKALENYTGDYYQHSQYNMIVDKAWIEERIKTPYMFKDKLEW